MAQMKRLDYDTRMKYYLAKFKNDTEIAYDPDMFENALIDHAEFNKFATMCVNYDLQKKYGLMAQTDIVYCIRNYDDYFARYGMDSWWTLNSDSIWINSFISVFIFLISFLDLDIYDILFVALCVCLMTAIVMSSLYDFYLKRQNLPHMTNREHYQRPVGRGRKC